MKKANKIESLTNSLKLINKNINPNENEIDDDVATDFDKARECARKIRIELTKKYPKYKITLNLTGGTKIMACAFWLEFYGHPIIYTDTQYNCFRFLNSGKSDQMDLKNLSIKNLLKFNNYKIQSVASDNDIWKDRCSQRIHLTLWLAKQNKDIISQLNILINDIENQAIKKFGDNKWNSIIQNPFIKNSIDLSTFPSSVKINEKLEDKLIKSNLVNKNSHKKLSVTSIVAIRYLSGGWLEELAWLLAKECGADECLANVKLKTASNKTNTNAQQTENEIDLIVRYQAKMMIVECKTISWSKEKGKQDIFNKLTTLGTYASGRLFGKTVLLTTHPVKASINDPDRWQRLIDIYRIKLISINNSRDRIWNVDVPKLWNILCEFTNQSMKILPKDIY